MIGVPAVVFSDTSDILGDNWSTTGTVTDGWSETTLEFHSAPSSFTDSKYGNYKPNSLAEMELKDYIDLSGLVKPELSFWTKFDIENDWDFAQVKIKSEEDSAWTAVGGKYSNQSSGQFQPEEELVYDGSQLSWVKEVIDLSDFEEEKIKIKFELQSDESVESDGWYVDDIMVYWYSDEPSDIGDRDQLANNFTYRLEQNYPNPFNPTTVINYSIPAFENSPPGRSRPKGRGGSIPVKLVIYDMLGKEVATLVEAAQRPGSYKVKWNASGHASGVYLYKLTAGSFYASKKMILLR
jgi:hypothetical protein